MNSDIQQAPIQFKSLGILDYTSTWEAMKTFTINRTPEQQDECWLLQHHPVFTLGQAGKSDHIIDSHDIPIIKSDRGGQVTYHGPGQLVAYALINLKQRRLGIRQLVDFMEKSIIDLLGSYGINADTKKGAPGVYVGDKKIAALGLRIKNGCSYHGLSLNVDMDLTPFSYINPCGFPGMQVTQISDLLSDTTDDLLVDAEKKLIKVLSGTLL